MYKVFGDLHITGNEIIDKSIINWLKNQIKKDDIIIFLGDIFDSFNVGAKNNLFYKFLSILKNEVYIICGNHDISQNRNTLLLVNNFSKNIKIIEDYEYIDINNFRLHFKNYFKTNIFNFDIAENQKNILFTHYDLNVFEPPKEFRVFDLVVSGHIHDFQKNLKYISLGAVRKCKINESEDKRYMVLNLENNELKYEFIKFKTIIDIKEVITRDLKDVVIIKSTILKVLLTGFQESKTILNDIKCLDWYDKNKVILKLEKFIDNVILSNIISNLSDNDFFDINKIFNNYLDIYEQKFKDFDINKKQLKNVFNIIYEKDIEKINELFNIYSINFKSIEAKNFKLFKSMKLDFSNYNNSIISIRGNNYDEIDNDTKSSNESGKSQIRNIIEFGFLGAKSEVKPLRYGERSGWIKLNIRINDDDILIERRFTRNTNSTDITINEKVFNPDETNTDKMIMFFEKYKIQDAIPFILVSDTGMARYFFSSKNSEKFKIFKNIFPIINYISNFLLTIKELVKEKKEIYETNNNIKNTISTNRNNKANIYIKEYFKYNNELNNINKNIYDIKNNINNINKNIDDNLIKNENNINLTNNYLNENLKENLIYTYNINIKFKDDNIFNLFKQYEKYNKIKIQNNLEEQKINQFQSFILHEKNNLKEFKKINNDLQKELETFDINNLNNIDITNIKNILFLQQKYESIFQKHGIITEENNLKTIETLTKEIHFYKTELETLKEQVLTLEKEKENIEVIICPNCNFNIHDKKRIDFLNNQINMFKTKGKEILKKYNEIKNNLIIEKQKYKRWQEKYNQIKPIFKEYIDYIKKRKEYIETTKDWTLKKIESFFEQKNKYYSIISKLEINKKIINQKESILRQKEEELKTIKTIPLPDFNETLYQEIIKELIIYNISNDEYISYNNIINKIISLKILKSINESEIQKFNKTFNELKNSLEQQKELFLQKEKLKLFEQQKESILRQKETLYQEIKQTQKELSTKKIKQTIKENLQNYTQYNNLYQILTIKRNFNFEKYFINLFFEKMTSIFNTFLSILFNRHIKLEANESNFLFQDGNQKELSFSSYFSNGAKTKIEASLLFTINILFSNYGVASNILILDEIFDKGIDGVNLRRLFEVLRKFFSQNKKIFVMSHKNIDDFVDEKIQIERKNNCSFLK